MGKRLADEIYASISESEHVLFDVEDATLPAAGKVALWTKADSVTAFDDLRIESLDGAVP